MSDDINALRAALFETLRAIKDGTVDLDKAKAINETAQTIINSAKVEVDFMRQTGQNTGSGFMPLAQPDKPKRPQIEYVGQPVRGSLTAKI